MSLERRPRGLEPFLIFDWGRNHPQVNRVREHTRNGLQREGRKRAVETQRTHPSSVGGSTSSGGRGGGINARGRRREGVATGGQVLSDLDNLLLLLVLALALGLGIKRRPASLPG